MTATPMAGIGRKTEDMETSELVTAYRHAHALAGFNPPPPLAKALAGWMFTARRVLETRGQHDLSHLDSSRDHVR